MMESQFCPSCGLRHVRGVDSGIIAARWDDVEPDGIGRIIDCEGCGERVEIALPIVANPQIMREQSFNTAPGRVTINYGGMTLHQCADGSYLSPDEVAPPKAT
jgi:hypothetical protein